MECMNDWIESGLVALAQQAGMRVTITSTRGSVPRGPDTHMLVLPDALFGTIGGGQLEHQAVAHARAILAGENRPLQLQQALGPSLGQCCGGAVTLSFEPVGAADAVRLRALLQPVRWPLALFGGGHVGRALVQALAPLPFAIRWIDSRDEIFPTDGPDWVQCEHSSPVQAAVPRLAPDSQVLIMSFSHAEDLDIVRACLDRSREQGDLPFIGLIGSRTKWATFRHRLEARGYKPDEIARVTCPIGLPGIRGKAPEVIAASVVAQLLIERGSAES